MLKYIDWDIVKYCISETKTIYISNLAVNVIKISNILI